MALEVIELSDKHRHLLKRLAELIPDLDSDAPESLQRKSAARISRIWAALSGLPIPSPARPRRVRWGQTCSEIKYRALLTIPPRLGYSRTDRLSRQDCCQRVNRVLKFKYNIKHI